MRELLWELVCGHMRVANDPNKKPGLDDAACFKCRAFQPILRVVPGYSVKCDSCSYARGTGAAQLEAKYLADKHARRHPGHRVAVYRANRKLGSTVVRPMDTLPLPREIRSGSDAPF